VLRHIEGLELTEVAEALGCSLATAKRKIAKASDHVFARAASDPFLSDYLKAEDPKTSMPNTHDDTEEHRG
jgi:RNA polymerase sigma-70 factor (ECF subfamily)